MADDTHSAVISRFPEISPETRASYSAQDAVRYLTIAHVHRTVGRESVYRLMGITALDDAAKALGFALVPEAMLTAAREAWLVLHEQHWSGGGGETPYAKPLDALTKALAEVRS